MVHVLKPEALVFTHPFPACAANLLKKEGEISTPLLGVITDFDIHQLWIYKHLDGYCVPTKELAEQLAGHGVPRDIIHTTGIPVRRAFYEEKKCADITDSGHRINHGGRIGARMYDRYTEASGCIG